MTKKKQYRPVAFTYSEQHYKIFGNREIWLAEQKRLNEKSKYTYIKGHYRTYKNGKKVFIKPYNRLKK